MNDIIETIIIFTILLVISPALIGIADQIVQDFIRFFFKK